MVKSIVPSSSPTQSTSVVVADSIGPVMAEIETIELSEHPLSSVTEI